MKYISTDASSYGLNGRLSYLAGFEYSGMVFLVFRGYTGYGDVDTLAVVRFDNLPDGWQSWPIVKRATGKNRRAIVAELAPHCPRLAQLAA